MTIIFTITTSLRVYSHLDCFLPLWFVLMIVDEGFVGRHHLSSTAITDHILLITIEICNASSQLHFKKDIAFRIIYITLANIHFDSKLIDNMDLFHILPKTIFSNSNFLNLNSLHSYNIIIRGRKVPLYPFAYDTRQLNRAVTQMGPKHRGPVRVTADEARQRSLSVQWL